LSILLPKLKTLILIWITVWDQNYIFLTRRISWFRGRPMSFNNSFGIYHFVSFSLFSSVFWFWSHVGEYLFFIRLRSHYLHILPLWVCWIVLPLNFGHSLLPPTNSLLLFLSSNYRNLLILTAAWNLSYVSCVMFWTLLNLFLLNLFSAFLRWYWPSCQFLNIVNVFDIRLQIIIYLLLGLRIILNFYKCIISTWSANRPYFLIFTNISRSLLFEVYVVERVVLIVHLCRRSLKSLVHLVGILLS